MKCPDCGKRKTEKVLRLSQYRRCPRCGVTFWNRKP